MAIVLSMLKSDIMGGGKESKMLKSDIIEKVNFYSQSIKDRLGNNAKQVILYGSRARGDYSEGSDYDFVIIVSHKDKLIREIVSNVSVDFLDKYNELAASLVYNEEEWINCLRLPLGHNIKKEGITL
jgi:uncharacterized protein